MTDDVIMFLFGVAVGVTVTALVLYLWLGRELRSVLRARDEVDEAIRLARHVKQESATDPVEIVEQAKRDHNIRGAEDSP